MLGTREAGAGGSPNKREVTGPRATTGKYGPMVSVLWGRGRGRSWRRERRMPWSAYDARGRNVRTHSLIPPAAFAIRHFYSPAHTHTHVWGKTVRLRHEKIRRRRLRRSHRYRIPMPPVQIRYRLGPPPSDDGPPVVTQTKLKLKTLWAVISSSSTSPSTKLTRPASSGAPPIPFPFMPPSNITQRIAMRLWGILRQNIHRRRMGKKYSPTFVSVSHGDNEAHVIWLKHHPIPNDTARHRHLQRYCCE